MLAEHGTTTDEGGLRWSFDPLHLTRAPYPFFEASFAEFLGAITAPTLLIWGAESWYSPELQAERAAHFSGARQLTLPGGHMLPYSCPRELGQAIEAFFAD